MQSIFFFKGWDMHFMQKKWTLRKNFFSDSIFWPWHQHHKPVRIGINGVSTRGKNTCSVVAIITVLKNTKRESHVFNRTTSIRLSPYQDCNNNSNILAATARRIEWCECENRHGWRISEHCRGNDAQAKVHVRLRYVVMLQRSDFVFRYIFFWWFIRVVFWRRRRW